MRKTLLVSAALLGAAAAAPAFAQTDPNTQPPAQAAPESAPAPQAGAGGTEAAPAQPAHMHHHGMAHHASNINASDTRSDIAPRLPTPHVGEDASPRDYLTDAQRALSRHRSGEAQEALERAETRILDRASATDTGNPGQDPMVQQIAQARQALANHDMAAARQAIDAALAGSGSTAGGAGAPAMGMAPANGAGAPGMSGGGNNATGGSPAMGAGAGTGDMGAGAGTTTNGQPKQ